MSSFDTVFWNDRSQYAFTPFSLVRRISLFLLVFRKNVHREKRRKEAYFCNKILQEYIHDCQMRATFAWRTLLDTDKLHSQMSANGVSAEKRNQQKIHWNIECKHEPWTTSGFSLDFLFLCYRTISFVVIVIFPCELVVLVVMPRLHVFDVVLKMGKKWGNRRRRWVSMCQKWVRRGSKIEWCCNFGCHIIALWVVKLWLASKKEEEDHVRSPGDGVEATEGDINFGCHIVALGVVKLWLASEKEKESHVRSPGKLQ